MSFRSKTLAERLGVAVVLVSHDTGGVFRPAAPPAFRNQIARRVPDRRGRDQLSFGAFGKWSRRLGVRASPVDRVQRCQRYQDCRAAAPRSCQLPRPICIGPIQSSASPTIHPAASRARLLSLFIRRGSVAFSSIGSASRPPRGSESQMRLVDCSSRRVCGCLEFLQLSGNKVTES